MSEDHESQKRIRHLLTHIEALEAERDRLKQSMIGYQRIFDRVSDRLYSDHPAGIAPSAEFEGITFVIVYYDIPKQIERTLLSCSPEYQGVAADEIEVIIIDNGSPVPMAPDIQERFPHVSRILRLENEPSPVAALNLGITEARHEMIALMIDGAHLLSPGVVRNAREIWSLFSNPVIHVPQYMLGRISQNLRTRADAFETEAADLAELGWPEDGYRLFDYAVYPGEVITRSYFDAIESNCLIATRKVLEKFGGFDPRYDEPGGGFANLEIFSRLIHEPENAYILLPGEGTFHQDHSGVTTNSLPEERQRRVDKYREKHFEVTGSKATQNARSPFLYGKVRRTIHGIPTISHEFNKAAARIVRHMAQIHVGRIRAGMTGPYPLELATAGLPDERKPRVPLPPAGLLKEAAHRNGVQEGKLSYLLNLKAVHKIVKPELYFEIGIDTGESLALADCPSVGVDPAYMLSNPIKAPTRIFRQTSDDFFADGERCRDVIGQGIDLAFIDGMHLAEFVLRDFIQTEKWMRPGGVILFDDVLPEQMEMLERERRFNAWCGDVFKIVPILRRYRPELSVSVFETFIGPYRKGLAMVTGLDPENEVLSERYEEIEADILAGAYDVASIEELDRVMRPAPIGDLVTAAQNRTRTNLKARLAASPAKETHRGPKVPDDPALSVVVVAYNMARELPRTLRSLAPDRQTDLAGKPYEIIVVDNGSVQPADFDACAMAAPNARFITLPAGRASPCHAVNTGIAAARAPRIGVLIDGARMASPGLIAAAIKALGTDGSAVVGTHGFHLGHKIQSEAILNGYDAAAEDALLDQSGWEQDGYRLFAISVFSKSSGKGWDVVPSESNALFMHRDMWLDLNGYDEGFACPGGGLANLDMWKRACEWPGARVRMILGEATFHQVHGGATTGSAASRRDEFDREYETLRGKPYKRPDVTAEFLGDLTMTRQSEPAAE